MSYEGKLYHPCYRWQLACLTLAMLCHATPLYAQEQAQPHSKPVELDASEIVVTGRKSPRQLDGARPIDDLSAPRLSTYGARSIAELIERLRQQQGGRPFSIVVNGRRIQSLSDINDLPAEALESAQIFSPADAQRFGYAATDRLLNLTFKKNFRTLAADLDGDGSSDGGAKSGSGTLRGVRLAGESRLNSTASTKTAAGLLSSQRPLTDESASSSLINQSLIPRSQQFTATFGAAIPIGSNVADIGARGERLASSRQMAGSALIQRDVTESGGINLSYNKTFNGFFLTLLSAVEYSRAVSRVQSEGGCKDSFVRRCYRQDLLTTTFGTETESVLSGKIVAVPAGEVRMDVALSRRQSLTYAKDRLNSRQERTSYGTTTSRLNINFPLVAPGTTPLGFLGRVDVIPSIDYNAADGIGGAAGINMGFIWSPSSSLQINASSSRRTVLASNADVNAPEQILVGLTAYDYRTMAIVPIEQIIGGARLPPQIMLERNISTAFNKAVGRVQLAANLTFASTEARRPPISLREPTAFLESIFPNRFTRSANGTLVRVDTRPFSAISQSTSTLSASLNLSGAWNANAASEASGTAWTIGIQGERQLKQSLMVAFGAPVIDLLRNPLNLSTGGGGPTRVNVQLAITSAHLGGNLNARWVSGLRSVSAADPFSGVRIGALTRIDASVFATLRERQGPDGNGTGYRLQLSINNILNTRPRVETFNAGGTTRLNPSLLDPIGRQVLVTLRIPLVG